MRAGERGITTSGHAENPPAALARTDLWEAVSLPIACVLLSVLAAQCLLFIREASQTSDEAVHLAAGYSYLTTGDFRLNPEHPPLVKMWSALPLLFLDLKFPRDLLGDRADQIEIGRLFVHENRLSNETILLAGRLPVLCLSLVLGWTLFSWGRELFGARGALLCLALYALDPNVVTHSGLVTTDLGVTLFIFLTVYGLWRWLRRPSPGRLVLSGLAVGAAFASKFTALWILLILGALACVLLETKTAFPAWPWRSRSPLLPGPGATVRRLCALALVAGLLLVCSATIVATSYAVRGLPAFFAGLNVGGEHVTHGHAAYLLGNFSLSGWWYYFPLAFAVKTPIGTLILLGLGLATAVRGARLPFADEAFIWIPIAVVGIVTGWFFVQIGLRHMLPAYPFIFLIAGRIGATTIPRAERRALLPGARGARAALVSGIVAACLLGNIVEAASIAPHYLAYFNALIGGPRNGHHYLLDSNLDWGQASKALRRFAEEAHVPVIYCAYTSNSDPWYYGVRYQYVSGVGNVESLTHRPEHVPDGAPEYLAVSATVLHAPFDPGGRRFEWLDSRRPIAMPGYSYLVYDITGDAESHARLASIYLQTDRREPAEAEARRALHLDAHNRLARSVLDRLGL